MELAENPRDGWARTMLRGWVEENHGCGGKATVAEKPHPWDVAGKPQ